MNEHSRITTGTLPENICDTHAHVFPPGYPVAAGARYAMPPRTLSDYRLMARNLGITRTVLVTPSVYGTDNASLLDSLAQSPDLRGIATVTPDIGETDLDRLRGAGVVGIRLPAALQGDLSPELIDYWAARLAPRGMHLDLLLPRLPDLRSVVDAIARAAVPVVLDHLGRTRPDRDVPGPEFDRLVSLLRHEPHVWVKLSSWYRLSALPAPHPDIRPVVEDLARACPDRLLWATNWPHSGYDGPPVHDGTLLAMALEWLGDDALRQAVLVDNPARHYGFA